MRNHCGDFIFGFEHKLGHSSILKAELNAILTGVRLVVERVLFNFFMESDSQDAMNSVLARCNQFGVGWFLISLISLLLLEELTI